MMKKNDKRFLKEIDRVKNVIQTYSFQRNGVANYKVVVYEDMLNEVLNCQSDKERKILYNKLLTIK